MLPGWRERECGGHSEGMSVLQSASRLFITAPERERGTVLGIIWYATDADGTPLPDQGEGHHRDWPVVLSTGNRRRSPAITGVNEIPLDKPYYYTLKRGTVLPASITKSVPLSALKGTLSWAHWHNSWSPTSWSAEERGYVTDCWTVNVAWLSLVRIAPVYGWGGVAVYVNCLFGAICRVVGTVTEDSGSFEGKNYLLCVCVPMYIYIMRSLHIKAFYV